MKYYPLICHVLAMKLHTKRNKMNAYKTYKFTFGKNTYSVVIGGGYITVIKTSLPKSMQFGKTFKSWNECESSYKCANLKSAFLMIQSGLVSPSI